MGRRRGEKKNLRFSILHVYRIYLQFTSEMFADESGLKVFWTLFGNFNHLYWERGVGGGGGTLGRASLAV